MIASRLSAFLAPAALAAAFAAAPEARAVTVDFSGSQYADNFTETSNGSMLNVVSDELRMSNSATASGFAIYNNAFPATGIDEFTLSIDGKFSTMPTTGDGTSVGFLTNLREGSGYAAIFRIRTSGGVSSADFRVFSATTTALGSQLNATQTLSSAQLRATFAANTYYKFSVSIDTSTDGQIEFVGSILDAAGTTTLGSFSSYTTSYTNNALATSVGLRLGVQTSSVVTTVDNFTLTTTAVPEPSSFAAFGGLAVLGFAALRRRRA